MIGRFVGGPQRGAFYDFLSTLFQITRMIYVRLSTFQLYFSYLLFFWIFLLGDHYQIRQLYFARSLSGAFMALSFCYIIGDGSVCICFYLSFLCPSHLSLLFLLHLLDILWYSFLFYFILVLQIK